MVGRGNYKFIEFHKQMKMNLLKLIILNIVVVYLIITNIGTVWKLFNGTFKNGNEIVYKGKVLDTMTKDCMLSTTENFEEIKMICPKDNNRKTWIKGVLQTNN